MPEIKVRARDLVGKVVVSDEAGKKFGRVGDVSFIADTGELMNLLLIEPTKATQDLHLQQDEQNRHLVPFSAVKSVGDFVIVSEKEIF